MSILMWDKPKKVRSKEEWAAHGFEDGPTGAYISNMSEDDARRWKAKITGTKLGFPQVEIRKTTMAGVQMTIIVNLGAGYNYKYYRAVDEKYKDWTLDDFRREYAILADDPKYDAAYVRQMGHPTEGINVHIALNGPAQMTFQDMADMQAAIEEAKTALEELETKP